MYYQYRCATDELNELRQVESDQRDGKPRKKVVFFLTQMCSTSCTTVTEVSSEVGHVFTTHYCMPVFGLLGYSILGIVVVGVEAMIVATGGRISIRTGPP